MKLYVFAAIRQFSRASTVSLIGGRYIGLPYPLPKTVVPQRVGGASYHLFIAQRARRPQSEYEASWSRARANAPQSEPEFEAPPT